MKKAVMIRIGLAASATALLMSSLALGQSTAPPRPTPENDSVRITAAGHGGSTAPAPQLPLALLMQRNGGSLAQATMESAPPPEPGKTAQVAYSYYSVPEPQPKVVKKHDLVTIVVREDSNFSSEGTTDLQKHSDFDSEIDQWMQLHLNPVGLVGYDPTQPLALQLQHTRDFKGQATVDRTDTMTARITAEVVDVKPNGNLVLQATKTIKTDDEEQMFTLIGTCRVDDVAADNTVLSTQLYSLELTKTHTGAVKDTTHRGFFMRMLDAFDPF